MNKILKITVSRIDLAQLRNAVIRVLFLFYIKVSAYIRINDISSNRLHIHKNIIGLSGCHLEA